MLKKEVIFPIPIQIKSGETLSIKWDQYQDGKMKLLETKVTDKDNNIKEKIIYNHEEN